MSRAKKPLLWVMAVAYCFAGSYHLVNPGFYLPIMPPGLPAPEWLHVIAGLFEIVLGVYVLEPKTRILAAWGLIALLIAVFPANLYAALENVGPEGPGTGPGAIGWVRLPFQAVFIVWAWWYTVPDEETRGAHL